MADIRFRCPKCTGRLVIDDQGARQRILCPHCSRHISVPAASTEPPPDAERESLRVSREKLFAAPTTNASKGAPGAYMVWVKCPGCGHKDMHLKCFNCGSEDKFWVQHDGALCYCGSHTARVRCPECGTAIRRQFFRALVEPIHAHEGLSGSVAVTGEKG